MPRPGPVDSNLLKNGIEECVSGLMKVAEAVGLNKKNLNDIVNNALNAQGARHGASNFRAISHKQRLDESAKVLDNNSPKPPSRN